MITVRGDLKQSNFVPLYFEVDGPSLNEIAPGRGSAWSNPRWRAVIKANIVHDHGLFDLKQSSFVHFI